MSREVGTGAREFAHRHAARVDDADRAGTDEEIDIEITADHADHAQVAHLAANELAQESLFEALRSKLALLQDMVALINEMRKGNQEGAARIVSELEQ